MQLMMERSDGEREREKWEKKAKNWEKKWNLEMSFLVRKLEKRIILGREITFLSWKNLWKNGRKITIWRRKISRKMG